jgi:hypothetical protein
MAGQSYFSLNTPSHPLKTEPQESTFVGLDMKDIQPNFEVLADATKEYEDMAKRIKWVHQNL